MKAPSTMIAQAFLDHLNAYQRAGQFHPFTCGNNRSDDAHRAYQATHPDEDLGQLIATTQGWRCPVCDYRQPFRDLETDAARLTATEQPNALIAHRVLTSY